VKSPRKVGVVDYGTGNLRSVVKAFEFLGTDARIVNKPSRMKNLDALVFPGQGTFDQCIRALRDTGLDAAITKWIQEDRPYFGICLGLQVLFEGSEEGKHSGLHLFSGRVKRFSLPEGIKIPHMGWNGVDWKLSAQDPMLRDLADGDQFYFVHSYHVVDEDKRLAVMKTQYGYPFTSGISYNNCFATQFHPEKSQSKGLQIYRNFLEKISQ
jgi:imidazole glycerol-phosphate synthase subunit HisH